MATEAPEVELGDPGVAKRSRPRWTIGRVATDLAIIMVAVPLGSNILAGSRVRGECATTLDTAAMIWGVCFLGARLAWIPLKASNDAFERWHAQRDESRPRPKPQPLDDF